MCPGFLVGLLTSGLLVAAVSAQENLKAGIEPTRASQLAAVTGTPRRRLLPLNAKTCPCRWAGRDI